MLCVTYVLHHTVVLPSAVSVIGRNFVFLVLSTPTLIWGSCPGKDKSGENNVWLERQDGGEGRNRHRRTGRQTDRKIDRKTEGGKGRETDTDRQRQKDRGREQASDSL